MTPTELATLLEKLVSSSDKAYTKAITGIQNTLYDDLVVIFKDFELDASGHIKQSAANRKVLREADKTVQAKFNSPGYVNAVSAYASAIPTIDGIVGDYFASVSESFKPNRAFLKDLQASTIESVEKYLLQDGLQSQVITPLSQIMSQNVNSGGAYSGFLDQIKTYVKGNSDVEGRALQYTRTYLNDTLFTYGRTYQQAVTADLKLQFYYYVGGLIDTSRPFCVARAGKYFHEEEVKSWANLEWSGKKQGTTASSIFVYAGGHNCSHQIVPVSEAIVPKEVIDRAKSEGFI